MLPFLLLVVGVLYVISESFAFKPMSRLAQVGIPTYSMVMALVTLARDPAQLPWLAVVAPVGVLIGWLQTTHVQVRVTGGTDKHHRHIVEVRRGWTYALGWALVFAAGIGFHGVLQGAMPWDEILEDLAKDVERDLFTILLFTSGLNWYVYALSGTAGYTYALVLRLTNIHVAEALHEAPAVCTERCASRTAPCSVWWIGAGGVGERHWTAMPRPLRKSSEMRNEKQG